MEVNRYPTMDDLVSLITKIADNQDKMLEIMTMDPEDARSVLNAWYGKMVMDEVQKKFWTANEIGKKDEEIQDLKLENDRLKQRDAIMLRFIKSLCCSGEICSRECDLYFEWNDHDCCALLHPKELDHVANDILKKLEEL